MTSRARSGGSASRNRRASGSGSRPRASATWSGAASARIAAARSSSSSPRIWTWRSGAISSKTSPARPTSSRLSSSAACRYGSASARSAMRAGCKRATCGVMPSCGNVRFGSPRRISTSPQSMRCARPPGANSRRPSHRPTTRRRIAWSVASTPPTTSRPPSCPPPESPRSAARGRSRAPSAGGPGRAPGRRGRRASTARTLRGLPPIAVARRRGRRRGSGRRPQHLIPRDQPARRPWPSSLHQEAGNGRVRAAEQVHRQVGQATAPSARSTTVRGRIP